MLISKSRMGHNQQKYPIFNQMKDMQVVHVLKINTIA